MKRILMKVKKFNAERDKETQLYPALMHEFTDPDLSCLTGHKTGMAGHFLFLFNLTREINAQHIVEIGFGGANSAMVFMLALKETGGHLTSIDINPSPIAIQKIEAMELMSQFHLICGASQDVMIVRRLKGLFNIQLYLRRGYTNAYNCRIAMAFL